MSPIHVAARALLATVFAVAAVTKLMDRAGSRQAVIDFGFPVRSAPLLGFTVPLAELLVALALIPHGTARWGAVGALTLLTAFLLVIGLSLSQGRTPECHCFGRLEAAPIGRITLARNLFLAGAAALVAWPSPTATVPGPPHGTGTITTAHPDLTETAIFLSIVAAVLGWILLPRFMGDRRLPSQTAEPAFRNAGDSPQATAIERTLPHPLRDRPRGLPVGSPAPDFELPSAHGEISLGDLQSPGLPIILFFLSPNCSACIILIRDVERWQREHAGKLTLAIVTGGTEEQIRTRFSGPGLPPVLLQRNREVSERYGNLGSPGAVLVWSDGLIGSPVVMGTHPIQNLVARVIATLREPARVPVPSGGPPGEPRLH